MNKGLEVIEAHWLFDFPYEQIEVLVHPQSIIHSMVRYHDETIIANLGCPDMRIPIQYALTYPERWQNTLKSLDLAKVAKLTFESPDMNRFPCLKLAYEAGKAGNIFPTVLNAANEVAVDLFLKGQIKFTQISDLVETALEKCNGVVSVNLESIVGIDEETRYLSENVYVKGLIN